MKQPAHPLVTVVIPTYNHANHLGRALQSLLDQTFKDWEAIVVDNHSEDGTEVVLDKYRDERISHIKIRNNGVIAKSRNVGIRVAAGEWIAFLDSDDYWDSKKLETCLSQSIDEIDFIYHKLRCYSVDGNGVAKISGVLRGRDVSISPYLDLSEGGPAIVTSSVFVRKSSLFRVNNFDESLNLVGGEDYDLWLRLAIDNVRFKYIKKYLGYYLIGGVHVTSPAKAARITEYLKAKFWNNNFSSAPNWLHKTMLSSLVKTHKYADAIKYTYLIIFNLRLLRFFQITYSIFKTIILYKIFKIRLLC